MSETTRTTTPTLEEVRARICAVLVEPEEDWLAHAERMIERYQNFLRKRTNYDTTTLGGRLRAARQLAGLDQLHLARRTGMRQLDISGIERNKRKLPIHKIRPLCITLRCTQDWLLGNTEEGGPPAQGGTLRPRITADHERKLKAVKEREAARQEVQRRNATRVKPST